MNLTDVLSYTIPIAALLVGLTIAVRWVWRSLGSTRMEVSSYPILPPGQGPTEEDFQALAYSYHQDREEAVQRCPCGDVATHAAPRLVRERIDGRQQMYASAPRYRRVVPRDSYLWGIIELDIVDKPELCEAHAHMADSEMDHFIFTEIRAEQSKLNQKIATRASEFETEKLMQRIRDNLTEEQKKKVRQLQQQKKQLRAVNGGTSEYPAAEG